VQEQTCSSKTPQADLIYLRLAQNTEQTRQELKAFEDRRDEATLAPFFFFFVARSGSAAGTRREREAKAPERRQSPCLGACRQTLSFFFLSLLFPDRIWTSRNRSTWQLGAIEQLPSAKKKPISLISTENNLIGKLCEKNNSQIKNQQNYSQ
jgi:hypothetical protein